MSISLHSRRWLPFGVAVAFAAIGIACGMCVMVRHDADRQRQILKELGVVDAESVGYGKFSGPGMAWWSPRYPTGALDQIGISSPFRTVAAIRIGNYAFEDAIISRLLELSDLEELDLPQGSAGGVVIRRISELPRLKRLVAMGNRLTDSDFCDIGRLAELEELHLSDTAVGDSGVREIVKCRRLRWLSLPRTKISDEGLLMLRQLPNLRCLIVNGCELTERSLEGLASFPVLESLGFKGIVTDWESLSRLEQSKPNLMIDKDLDFIR